MKYVRFKKLVRMVLPIFCFLSKQILDICKNDFTETSKVLFDPCFLVCYSVSRMKKKMNILTKDKNFKMLFGSDEHINILTRFLSSVLNIPYKKLKVKLVKRALDEKAVVVS